MLAIGGLGLLPSLALAQSSPQEAIELIVRAETRQSSLQKTLRNGSIPKTDSDSLFSGVQSLSSVFGNRTQERKGTTPHRIPAFRLRVTDSTAFRRLLSQWQRHPDIRYAHPNVQFRVQGLQNTDHPVLREDNVLADSLTHLSVVGATDAWDTTTGDSDVRIGVVDTGIFLEHPDLNNQFWINDAEDINGNGQLDPYPVEEGGDLNGIDDDDNGYVDDVIGYDFVDRPSAILDGDFTDRDPDPSADRTEESNGHGTAVAGVVSASPGAANRGIAGVAPDTRLVALRAFGRDGLAQSDDIAAAIMYGAENDLDILNLSFGRDRAVPLIEDAIKHANDQGTIVVGSAGNRLTDDPHYPSDYPEVLSVVWLGEDGQLPQVNQSRFGIGVDLGAPGSNVYTADFPAEAVRADEPLELDDLYSRYTGSSFSAPQVAGAAALLRSADSSLSPASVRSILTSTAEDIEGANWDHQTGAGLLNADQALMRAYPARTEITDPSHNQGVQGQSSLAIRGSVIDPAFKHYALYFAKGTRDLGQRRDPWTEITPPTSQQKLRDTLGVWSEQALSDLEEGEYTIRLVTTLNDGGTIEDRRRLRIDSSKAEVEVSFLGSGRVEGENGIVAEVQTDDVTRLRMQVQIGNRETTVLSENKARRHGITWPDETGTGGRAVLKLDATNSSGLTTTIDTSLRIPASRENNRLFERTRTSLPQGRLLSSSVDFDGDGLNEVLLNQFAGGGLSDTLRSFEWDGSRLVPKDTLVVGSYFPKDVGDTNGDGLEELLLQKNRSTFLLEQPNETGFPSDPIFPANSSVSDPPEDTLEGSRLADLDGDSRGEVIGTSGKQWTVLERKADGFQEIARLSNPTEISLDSSRGNQFDLVESAMGDFDGDGRGNLLVGDRDGDLIVYEAKADDQIEPTWTEETDRVRAGSGFTVGDFSGTGRTDFVTVTTTPDLPSISYYSVWRRSGDDAYERSFRLPIPGPFLPKGGGLESADFDGDGRPEIVIAHPPSLIILDQSPAGSWRVLYEDRNSSILGRGFLAADVSGSGQPSIIALTNAGEMVRYKSNPDALGVTPPQWIRARPQDASSTALSWRASGADSVRVYAGRPSDELDAIVTTTDSSTTVSGSTTRRYRLRAWQDGSQSLLSPTRTVRPHPPARVADVSYPNSSTVEVQFTEALAANLRVDQFQFGSAGTSPQRLGRTRSGEAVVLHFPSEVAGQTGQLTWTGVSDADGLGVGQSATEVTFPTSEQRSLFIEEATVLDERRVRLAFSDPLDPTAAQERDRYEVRPRGRVASVQFESDSSRIVTLRVSGLVLGASGQESSLTVTDMITADGNRLSQEGGTVRLTRPADDLSNVFVYPNPYRISTHEGPLTVAGLPSEATIRIYTPSGRLVRTLSVERTRDGGQEWNLHDERGEQVSSGVYLFRVNAPDETPVLEKAAIIR